MDRIDSLHVFLRVAETGSFSTAADDLGRSRASVSATVQQLEARLGVRLLHRTTRSVRLTADGSALLERARQLVADMAELEEQFQPAAAHQHGGLRGHLRVDVPSRIARRIVAPALPGFFARHPGVTLELRSSDRAVDLVQEGVDCVLRVGPLAPSSLVARPLGHFALINCASPAYLARHGTPQTPGDLAAHRVVDYLSPTTGRPAPWEIAQPGGQAATRTLPAQVAANHVETYIACALAGLGLIQIPAYDVREHLESGALVEVLPHARAAPMPVHVLYPHRRHLSLRVQGFIAWLQEQLAPCLDAPLSAAR